MHTGEGKFACDGERGCGRKFARSDAFFRHLGSAAGKRYCHAGHENVATASPLRHQDAISNERDTESHKSLESLPMSLIEEDWSLGNIYGGLDSDPSEEKRSDITRMPGQNYAAWWDSYAAAMGLKTAGNV